MPSISPLNFGTSLNTGFGLFGRTLFLRRSTLVTAFSDFAAKVLRWPRHQKKNPRNDVLKKFLHVIHTRILYLMIFHATPLHFQICLGTVPCLILLLYELSSRQFRRKFSSFRFPPYIVVLFNLNASDGRRFCRNGVGPS